MQKYLFQVFLAMSCFALVVVLPAHAAENARYAHLEDIPDALLTPLFPSKLKLLTEPEKALAKQDFGLEEYTEHVLEGMRKSIPAHGALTQEKLELLKARMERFYTEKQIGEILYYDANMDGKVTEAEFREFYIQEYKGSEEDLALYKDVIPAALMLKHDHDKDGAVSVADLRVLTLPEEARTQLFLLESLLALEPDGDEKLTFDELKSLAEKSFRTMDKDQDGTVSSSERPAKRKPLAPPQTP